MATNVAILFFSATGSTRTIVDKIGSVLSKRLGVPVRTVDLGTAEGRSAGLRFTSDDLVVVASPTYGGRLPTHIFDGFADRIKGDGTPAVEVVTYGNRAYENSLAQMDSMLRGCGLSPVAAAAFPCRHAYTYMLATGRPDKEDIALAGGFASQVASMVSEGVPLGPLQVPGDADAPPHIPLGVDGAPVDLIDARPVTDASKCIRCMKCAEMCPLGSISKDDPSLIVGECFRCQACVQGCPEDAKSFDDPNFISHVDRLEIDCMERKDIELFFSERSDDRARSYSERPFTGIRRTWSRSGSSAPRSS